MNVYFVKNLCKNTQNTCFLQEKRDVFTLFLSKNLRVRQKSGTFAQLFQSTT